MLFRSLLCRRGRVRPGGGRRLDPSAAGRGSSAGVRLFRRRRARPGALAAARSAPGSGAARRLGLRRAAWEDALCLFLAKQKEHVQCGGRLLGNDTCTWCSTQHGPSSCWDWWWVLVIPWYICLALFGVKITNVHCRSIWYFGACLPPAQVQGAHWSLGLLLVYQ